LIQHVLDNFTISFCDNKSVVEVKGDCDSCYFLCASCSLRIVAAFFLPEASSRQLWDFWVDAAGVLHSS